MRYINLLLAFACGFAACFAWQLFRDCGVEPQVQINSVTDQMKAIQVRVGCVKIDGKIGTETTPLVNAAVKREQKELFNRYAAKYMTESGSPNNMEAK